jgi:hypothetical protein
MRSKDIPIACRIVNLIKMVRTIGTLFPGNKIELPGEKPATCLAAPCQNGQRYSGQSSQPVPWNFSPARKIWRHTREHWIIPAYP